MNKRIKYLPILIAIIFSNSIFTPNLSTKADFEGNLIDFNNSDALIAEYKTGIPQNKNRMELSEPKQIKIWITAYSSTPEETDSTPFITASGSHVRNGVAAANFCRSEQNSAFQSFSAIKFLLLKTECIQDFQTEWIFGLKPKKTLKIRQTIR